MASNTTTSLPISDSMDRTTPRPHEPRQHTIVRQSGNTYTRKAGKASTKLSLHPLPLIQRWQQPWIGAMDIKCDDVAYMMRHGLRWNLNNIIREEGSFESNVEAPSTCPKYATQRGWNKEWAHARHFILRDLQHEPPLWVAELVVYASNVDILRRVRLDLLTINNVASMISCGVSGNLAYKYEAWDHEKSFIAIYDDMVMPGWWPWPGKEVAQMPMPMPIPKPAGKTDSYLGNRGQTDNSCRKIIKGAVKSIKVEMGRKIRHFTGLDR